MTHKPEHLNQAIEQVGQAEGNFYGLGIAPKILDILEGIKFKTPTPIQVKAIPLALQAKDVIGIAQTGTGKTHSFAIPIIQRLAQIKGAALILAPTRELAIQIDEAFLPLARPFGIKTACLIGGAPIEPQTQALRNNPRVVIATPGRLIDHMGQWNFLPDSVSILVLDEADRMLDMGFAPQIEKILRFLPKDRQTMLFSATMPAEIMEMVRRHMKLPVSVEIAPSGTTVEGVTQELFIVKREQKLRLLDKLLKQYRGSVLLFCRTKYNARKITMAVRGMRQSVAEIHSNRSLPQRREALEGFKSGKYKVLVATDIASRGIDVSGIELVINFDIPEDADSYVHRIGRTARAGQKGHAVSFATPEQSRDVRDIEKLIKITLPVSTHPEVPPARFEHAAAGRQQHPSRKQKRPRHNRGQHRIPNHRKSNY